MLATSGFASAGSVFPRLLNDLIGTKIKLIYGYKGGGAINLARHVGEPFDKSGREVGETTNHIVGNENLPVAGGRCANTDCRHGELSR